MSFIHHTVDPKENEQILEDILIFFTENRNLSYFLSRPVSLVTGFMDAGLILAS